MDTTMGKYKNMLADYSTFMDDGEVIVKTREILTKKSSENHTQDVYRLLFNCIDLTTLNTIDSNSSVAEFTEKVNRFAEEYPHMPNVAAICVYPNRAAVVRQTLEVSDVSIAAVAGCFPVSQSFTEVKVAEASLAVLDGADEIDIVISLGEFFAGEYDEMCEEISEIKCSMRDAHLKVILETGILKSAENIKKASLLSIFAGADFIKTSTGKVNPAATLEAAYVMCRVIKEYYVKTGVMIGFKPAGGIVTTEDAVNYYTIVKEILGDKWLNNRYFRLGASRLANNLLSSIAGSEVNFF